MNLATKQLQQFYKEFENEFKDFFAELMSFSAEKRQELETALL